MMLDEYCNKLNDSALNSLAIRLCRITLPFWTSYLKMHSDAIDIINGLITKDQRVQNGEEKISSDFLERVLNDLKSEIQSSQNLHESKILKDHLATIMQPLTNPAWDNTLDVSRRLIYTSIFNILTFLCLHRNNNEGETHIYVSINQSCDVILRESILSKEELESILLEYKKENRSPEEIQAGYSMTSADADSIISAMKDGLEYIREDYDDSYVNFWIYDTEKKLFLSQKIDTIVGYAPDDIEYSETEFREWIMKNFTFKKFMSDTYKSSPEKKI